MTRTNGGDVDPVGELRALVQASVPNKDKKRMNRDKPELPAYVLAMLAIVAIAVLTFHGDHVPEVLNLVTIGALGIGGAVTTPNAPKP